jgi:hypothetical protein
VCSANRGLGERLGERRAARHNAAPRVRCVQCEIRLLRELSGAGPDVQDLSQK